MNVEWIAYRTVLIFHDAQISEHGGAGGLRDEGGLRSALARPENLAAYGEPDLFDLAPPMLAASPRTTLLLMGTSERHSWLPLPSSI